MKLYLPLAASLVTATSAYSIGGGPQFYRTTMWPSTRLAPSAFDAVSPFGLSIMEDRMQQQQQQQRRRNNILRRQIQQLDRAFDLAGRIAVDPSLSSPAFRVLSDDSVSSVSVDVPGIPMGNIHIDIDDEDRLMTISGKREMTKDGVSSVTKFSRTFQIDDRARLEEISATLENGVLTVSAPKDPVVEEDPVDVEEKDQKKLRRIPIDLVEGANGGEADKAESNASESEAEVDAKVDAKEEVATEISADATNPDETIDLDAVADVAEAMKVQAQES